MSEVSARRATIDDAHYVWGVNNHPSVRAQARYTDDIPWETHASWYQRQLERTDGGLFIGLVEGQRFGVARFDVAGNEAVITIAVSPEHRGRGLGKRLVGLVTAEAFARPDVQVTVAYTRPGNLASQRAFLNNHYVQLGTADVAGVTMMRFERYRETL